MNYSHQLTILLDVVIATALTSLIGLEREKVDKPAGIRTNMIVGGFSCLTISLTVPLIELLDNYNYLEMLNADPVRVINALIVGLSFVGAGTILKSNNGTRVTGITTAATLLYSAGIGISVGLKQYILALGITILTIIINYVLPWVFRQREE